jgi:hypothetical protein
LQIKSLELAAGQQFVRRRGNRLAVANRQHQVRSPTRSDLMEYEYRQVIEEVDVVDTHHRFGAGRHIGQRFQHLPDNEQSVPR